MAWIENLDNLEDFSHEFTITTPVGIHFMGPVFLFNRAPYACWSNGEIRCLLDNSLLTTFTEMGYVGRFFASDRAIYGIGGVSGSNGVTGYFKKIVLATLAETTLYTHATANAANAHCSLVHPGEAVFTMGGDAFMTVRKIDLSDDSVTELVDLGAGLHNAKAGGTATTCYYSYRDGVIHYYKSVPMAGGGSTDIDNSSDTYFVGVDGWHLLGADIWNGPHTESWNYGTVEPKSLLILNKAVPFHVLVLTAESTVRRLLHLRLNADFSTTLIKEYYETDTAAANGYFYNSGINYPFAHGTVKPSVLYRPYYNKLLEWKLPYKDMI